MLLERLQTIFLQYKSNRPLFFLVRSVLETDCISKLHRKSGIGRLAPLPSATGYWVMSSRTQPTTLWACKSHEMPSPTWAADRYPVGGSKENCSKSIIVQICCSTHSLLSNSWRVNLLCLHLIKHSNTQHRVFFFMFYLIF